MQNQAVGIVLALVVGFVLGISTLNIVKEDDEIDSLPQTADNNEVLKDAANAMKEAAQELSKLSIKISKNRPQANRPSFV